MAVRKARAEWQGGLKDGSGTMSLGSGAFNGKYGFQSRFENGPGTNPEELIGAAHAGCFSMAFSKVLADAGFQPKRIATEAAVTLEAADGGFAITRINLANESEVDGIDEAKFRELADAAKKGCPVSKALAGVEIDLTAKLV
ncbi:MAG TPA: OsmC family protein [Alphaproteobacteria bacterium]|nr:OsmC family protein [Alphaproteobacteria bacterium]